MHVRHVCGSCRLPALVRFGLYLRYAYVAVCSRSGPLAVSRLALLSLKKVVVVCCCVLNEHIPRRLVLPADLGAGLTAGIPSDLPALSFLLNNFHGVMSLLAYCRPTTTNSPSYACTQRHRIFRRVSAPTGVRSLPRSVLRTLFTTDRGFHVHCKLHLHHFTWATHSSVFTQRTCRPNDDE